MALAVLQSVSLNPEAEIFLFEVTHCALEVFSSIDHVVKEHAQVIYELEKLREKNLSMSNLSYPLTKASRDWRK